MDSDVVINDALTLPLSEFSFRFSRSGGPGGQNVNKVSSRVEIEFDVMHSPALSEAQRQRLVRRLAGRIDGDGVLRVTADDSRSQWQNRRLAVERVAELMAGALKVQKHRIATRRTVASHSRRLGEKKRRGDLKKGRRDLE